MKKEIKEKILKNGQKFYRITTPDERWYGREEKNKETGLPEIRWLPSVTWIKNYYYTSPYLTRWIVDKGLTESERIKKEAGVKGDKIHQAIEELDERGILDIDSKFLNKETDTMEELTADELEAIISYQRFVDKEQPELIANEMTVFSERYAGTLDRIMAMNDGDKRQVWIVDIKTSQSIWKDMHIQVSAYSHADIDYQELGITDDEWNNRKLAILQLGYSRNKDGYKFTEIPDRYDLFEIAYKVWQEENPEAEPKQRDFPLEIVSEHRVKEIRSASKTEVKKKIKK